MEINMEKRFERFTALMTSIGRSIRKIKNEEMIEFDLKAPHVTCLYYLYSEGPLTAKALCDLCEEDKSNMSRIIDHLEERGFIVCSTSSTRRYRSPWRLSEKGVEVSEHISRKIDTVLNTAGEGISDEERAIMYSCLERINLNLQKVCNEYHS